MSTPPASPAPNARPKRTGRVLAAIFGVIALLLVVALVLGGRGGEDATEVETAEATVRTITETVTGSGEVRPEVEVPLASEVSGEVVFIAVEEGDRVEAGQLLVRIRGEQYAAGRQQSEASVLSARADAARAEAELAQARADLERQRGLFERGVIPRAELEAAETRAEVAGAAHEAARFRVRSAEAVLSQSADQLRRTAIYAPMSGTVSVLNVEPGERVLGTAQMAGTEIMRIAELDQMELEVDVNENDVVRVAVGDSAVVEVDAFPDRPFRGVVTQIANSARVAGAGTVEQVTSFPVKVKITSPHNQNLGLLRRASSDGGLTAAEAAEAAATDVPVLRPGMSGTVDVFTETVERAVVVPIQAVTVRDFNEARRWRARDDDAEEDGDGEAADAAGAVAAFAEEDLRRVVFVVREGVAEMVEVETGIADDTHIEVVRGLTGGEVVVAGPFRLLRTELDDGDAVVAEPARRGPSRS